MVVPIYCRDHRNAIGLQKRLRGSVLDTWFLRRCLFMDTPNSCSLAVRGAPWQKNEFIVVDKRSENKIITKG